MQSLKILIANVTLDGYTGTELVVRDMALGLKKLGHFPMIYSPRLGGVSQQIESAQIPVASQLSQIPKMPDIIHGNHHVETLQALLQFPGVPGIFVSHCSYGWENLPPQSNQLLGFAAVTPSYRQHMLTTCKIPEDHIQLICNWVDLQRYSLRQPLPAIPKRALVFSNSVHIASPMLQAIEIACEHCNIILDVVGFGVGKGCEYPETILGHYDLVFARGKCALEALAVGAAVILCDVEGLGEMVTMQNVHAFRSANFGISLLKKQHDTHQIVNEIKKFIAEDASQVTHYIRQEASLEKGLKQYLKLYRQVIGKGRNLLLTDSMQQATDNIRYCLQHIDALEQRLRQRFQMLPLTDEMFSQLSLEWIKYPDKILQDTYFVVTVSLANHSKTRLNSNLPAPIHWGYHWLYADSEEYFLFDSQRNNLEPELAPETQAEYRVSIRAPNVAGIFKLVVTLVQEEVCWFDELQSPIAVSTVLTVE